MEDWQVRHSLLEGGFSELVEYLRDGGVVQGDLATTLADFLDSSSNFDWKVKVSRRTKNRRTADRYEEDGWMRLEVGAWTHVWIEGHPRGLAQIIRRQMAERFEVGETFVREALAHFRKVKRLWEGEHNDYSVLRAGPGEGVFDIVYAKIFLSQAEEALAAAIDEMSEDKIQIPDSNRLG